MALSNIRNEPQREITESLVGIGCLVVVLWLDFWGSSLVNTRFFPKDPGMIVVLVIALPVTLFIFFLIGMGTIYGTHALGEKICGALARRGLELRPRERK